MNDVLPQPGTVGTGMLSPVISSLENDTVSNLNSVSNKTSDRASACIKMNGSSQYDNQSVELPDEGNNSSIASCQIERDSSSSQASPKQLNSDKEPISSAYSARRLFDMNKLAQDEKIKTISTFAPNIDIICEQVSEENSPKSMKI